MAKNELIINLKKGNRESMLFGTPKRLSNTNNNLTVYYRETIINFVIKYKYLGNILDNHLTFQTNFDSYYKKASGRLMLLSKMRPNLTEGDAKKVYDMMIVPLLTHTVVQSI